MDGMMDKTGAAADGPGLRNRFFPRKTMRAEDFRTEQAYMIARRRLVSRAVLGWGVVQGFAIAGAGTAGAGCDCDGAAPTLPPGDATPEAGSAPTPRLLEVGPGLALDHAGREAHLAAATVLDARNTFLLVEAPSGPSPRELAGLAAGRYILAVHYAECREGATVPGDCCCPGNGEATHLRETVRFSLRRLDDRCPCGELDCPGGTRCATDGCAGRRRSHARLVDWTTARGGIPTGTPLRRWKDCCVAIADPVDLACATIPACPDPCHPLEVTAVDASSPRRILKGNDLLFDLLTGRDLTRISGTSWSPWHRRAAPVAWDEFAALFPHSGPDPQPTGLVVHFSAPVRRDNLRPDVIAIAAVIDAQGSGWLRRRGVPIVGLDTTPEAAGLPPGTTDRFRVLVPGDWIHDEIERGARSELAVNGFTVEIEVRGDLIVDCSGQPVDANAIGLRAVPSGNGTPGGTYFSAFKVSGRTPS